MTQPTPVAPAPAHAQEPAPRRTTQMSIEQAHIGSSGLPGFLAALEPFLSKIGKGNPIRGAQFAVVGIYVLITVATLASVATRSRPGGPKNDLGVEIRAGNSGEILGNFLAVRNTSKEFLSAVRITVNGTWLHQIDILQPGQVKTILATDFKRSGERAPMKLKIENVSITSEQGEVHVSLTEEK